MKQKKKTFDSLRFPPAIEVVFDVSFVEEKHFDVNQFEIKNTPLNKKLPIVEKMNLFEGVINSEGAMSSSRHSMGFFYKSEDGKEQVQFRKNGFSYHKLGDYPGWDKFSESAMNALKVYQSLYNKASISRLGLRFINLISISDYNNNDKNFFNVFINTSEAKDIPTINQCRYRYSTEFKQLNCQANVNFGLSAIVDKTNAKFILDIDVFKDKAPISSQKKEILSSYNEMREAKNIIFFSTLNEKSLEQYK